MIIVRGLIRLQNVYIQNLIINLCLFLKATDTHLSEKTIPRKKFISGAFFISKVRLGKVGAFLRLI